MFLLSCHWEVIAFEYSWQGFGVLVVLIWIFERLA
jgi:hypothetical protein